MKKALIVAGLLAGLAAAPAQADDMPQQGSRRLIVQPRNQDGSIVLPRFQDDPVLWIRGEQQNFYSAMSRNMKDMGGGASKGGALALMLLSLGYGVFHAAGPGHGKTVVAGWLLATETQLRRGILVAFISAMVQALVAVLLVSGALLLVQGAAGVAKDLAGWMEMASFAMIAAMGAYLAWTGLKALRPVMAQPVHDHTHHFEIVNPLPAGAGQVHDHGHVHGPDCGHVHAPTAAEVSDADWSLGKAIAMAVAVGLRPCSGAILVLLFAYSIGLYWVGVASTFVMGLGTFATVSAIAALAVYAKALAERFASRDDRTLAWLNIALRVGGGLLIVLFGATLAYASWGGMGDGGF